MALATDSVVLLWHRYVVNEEGDVRSSKLLGVFSDEERALEAIGTFRALEGFRDHPEGFSVERIPLE